MDHPCHRCGTPVPENTPFCSQCGAPQIRVSVNRDDEGAPSPPPSSAGSAAASSGVMWSLAFPRALLAGILGTLILIAFQLLLPPLLVLLLLVPFTGAMAVWFYRTRDPLLNGGKGFRIGMIAGLMLFLVNLVIAVAGFLIDRNGAIDSIKKQLQTAAERSSDPNAQQMIKNIMDKPEALAGFLTIVAVFAFVVFVLFCGIGGAIAGRSARHG
jgi:hypothetical protein